MIPRLWDAARRRRSTERRNPRCLFGCRSLLLALVALGVFAAPAQCALVSAPQSPVETAETDPIRTVGVLSFVVLDASPDDVRSAGVAEDPDGRAVVSETTDASPLFARFWPDDGGGDCSFFQPPDTGRADLPSLRRLLPFVPSPDAASLSTTNGLPPEYWSPSRYNPDIWHWPGAWDHTPDAPPPERSLGLHGGSFA